MANSSIVDRALNSIPGYKQKYEMFFKELQVQQYSSGTIAGYLHKLSAICLHFHTIPDNLTADNCRDYFSMLLNRTPSPGISYFKHTVYSLRCYRKMMNVPAFSLSLPCIRKEKNLPVVLSQSEILRLLNCCPGIRCQMLFSLMYSCGLRVSELLHIRINHIDKDRKCILIKQGKGRKDRYVPLSEKILPELRKYYIQYQPQEYLFNDSPGKPIREMEVRYLFRDAIRLAGIKKPCTLHTLRHSYATHLLEMGENILRIRDLLGHSSIKSTLVYTHVASLSEGGVAFSPLDRLAWGETSQPSKL